MLKGAGQKSAARTASLLSRGVLPIKALHCYNLKLDADAETSWTRLAWGRFWWQALSRNLFAMVFVFPAFTALVDPRTVSWGSVSFTVIPSEWRTL